jgi:hypothetical protein
MHHFWMPEEVSVDFHRHLWVIAHRMRHPFGCDLKRGRFWLHDIPSVNLKFYGMYIQTDIGFEPYRVLLGEVEVGGYASFVDAYRGLHDIRTTVMLQHRHVECFGHPWTDACDPLDCTD